MPNVQTSGGYRISIAISEALTTALAGWLPWTGGPSSVTAPPRLITISTYASGRIVGDGTDVPSPATRQ